jgi:hypothetical protein
MSKEAMKQVLNVTQDGEFIWHPDADRLIEEGDFTGSPAMQHILRVLRAKQSDSVEQSTKCVGESDDLMIAYMSGLHDGKKLVGRGNKPCQTCEALARTVMLDQSSHDSIPQQRKPLTDEQIEKIWGIHKDDDEHFDITYERDITRAIESAHGITKE